MSLYLPTDRLGVLEELFQTAPTGEDRKRLRVHLLKSESLVSRYRLTAKYGDLVELFHPGDEDLSLRFL